MTYGQAITFIFTLYQAGLADALGVVQFTFNVVTQVGITNIGTFDPN